MTQTTSRLFEISYPTLYGRGTPLWDTQTLAGRTHWDGAMKRHLLQTFAQTRRFELLPITGRRTRKYITTFNNRYTTRQGA